MVELHGLDPNDLRVNIIQLRQQCRTDRNGELDQVRLHQDITKSMDVYGLGLVISQIMIRQSCISDTLRDGILRIARDMVEPIMARRITLTDALERWKRLPW